MKKETPCRCSECNAKFIPDPRVVERQVTCGATECQRARHAKKCGEWHAANKEETAGHYHDVIVPFRQRQPDYQRRWRWVQRLREIREKTAQLGRPLVAALRALVQQGEKLVAEATAVAQTGIFAGESLVRAVAVTHSAIAAFEQLEACAAELRELGP